MLVQPYLFLGGRCEEALGFYIEALGARVTMLMRFRDSPDPLPPGMVPPGTEDRIMHAAFQIGDSLIMASDGCATDAPAFQGFSLSVSVADEAEARARFDALGQGGEVQMPLGPTFFSPAFGMVKDRFGVGWMVIVPGDHGGS
jgi:PhnB protein